MLQTFLSAAAGSTYVFALLSSFFPSIHLPFNSPFYPPP
jgi:hypothetical protein